MNEAPVAVATDAGTVPDALVGADVRVVDPGTDTDALATARVVVAVGEPSLLSVARRRPDAPIAPVSTAAGRYDVPEAALGAVVDAAAAGDLRTTAHPTLDIAVDGDDVGTAITDVTLLTAAPARISEFGVAADDGWRASVRADGIVVATPLGSAGYARDAGGPALAPDTGLVAVPISAYAMHAHRWVLRPPLSLSVERDEADVTLRLDDAAVRSVPPNAPVEVTTSEPLSFVSPRQFPRE